MNTKTNNCGQMADQEQTKNEIPKAMEELEEEIRMLDSAATALANSIAPIVQQLPPTPSTDMKVACEIERFSEMASRLADRANSVRNIRHMLQEVHSRVAL